MEFFLAVARTSQCYTETQSDLSCFASGLFHDLKDNDWLGFSILYRLAFAELLFAATMLLLWIRYKLAMRRTHPAQNEMPGFLLWIANRCRSNKSLAYAHSLVVGRIVPLAFAIALVLTVICIVNRLSFDLMDTAGLLCPPMNIPGSRIFGKPPSVDQETTNGASSRQLESTDAPSSQHRPVVIEHDLSALCDKVNVQLKGDANYEVTIDYFEDLPRTETWHSEDGPDLSFPTAEADWLEFGASQVPYVPKSLYQVHEPLIALPFRRKIGAPWHAMIARNAIVAEETVFDRRTSTVRTGPDGELYFYVNEPVVGLPFFFDWFYKRRRDAARIMLKLHDDPTWYVDVRDVAAATPLARCLYHHHFV